MRPNRRGPGWSGSTSFLARALRHPEADLVTALAATGLTVDEKPGAKPAPVEIGAHVYWLNRDSRGGIWINGHERRETPVPAAGDRPPESGTPAATGPTGPAVEPVAAPDPAVPEDATPADNHPALTAVRLLLKPNKRGSGVSGEVSFLARTLEKDPEEFLAALLGAGLSLPVEGDEKPAFVEQGGEIFWLNENPRDESLWLNAKPAKKFPARKPVGREPAA